MADSVTDLLTLERRGPIALLRLNRPAKRNAVNDSLVLASVSYTHLTLPTILLV